MKIKIGRLILFLMLLCVEPLFAQKEPSPPPPPRYNRPLEIDDIRKRDGDETGEIRWGQTDISVISNPEKIKEFQANEALIQRYSKEIEDIKKNLENTPKGPFETTAEYEKRISKFSSRINEIELLQLQPALAKRNLFNSFFRIGALSAVKVELKTESYDADKGIWEVYIIDPWEKRKYPCEIYIAPSMAKSLWEKKEKISVYEVFSNEIPVGSNFLLTLNGVAGFQDIPLGRYAVEPQEDGIFEKVEIEASFPGGERQWVEYLSKALSSFNPSDKGAPVGKYTVYVQFIVDKDGSISSVRPLTRHGYGMEEAVIRVITNGPRWNPAIQNQRQVKAYRKQPVTFQIVK